MRLIFYIIIAYIVYVIAKKLLVASHSSTRRAGNVPGGAKSRGEGDAGAPAAEETVLDPVCGSYLAKDLALKVAEGGKTHYFCGEECRDKFTSESGG